MEKRLGDLPVGSKFIVSLEVVRHTSYGTTRFVTDSKESLSLSADLIMDVQNLKIPEPPIKVGANYKHKTYPVLSTVHFLSEDCVFYSWTDKNNIKHYHWCRPEDFRNSYEVGQD